MTTSNVSRNDVRHAIGRSLIKHRGNAGTTAALSKWKTSNEKRTPKNLTHVLLIAVAVLLVADLVKGVFRMDLSANFIEQRDIRQQSLDDEFVHSTTHTTTTQREDKKQTSSSSSSSRFLSQSYVISSHQQNAGVFAKRNRQAGFFRTTWFPATNGKDQSVLDEWSAITNTRLLNISNFDDETMKEGYNNPHVVGCYLSHWHLLRLALSGWRYLDTRAGEARRPDALFVFEDDAICANKTRQLAEETIRNLPEDWDLLFIGGKPFSYMEGGGGGRQMIIHNEANQSVFRDLLCEGEFGTSNSGPWAPDGSLDVPSDQPYWKIGYLSDTQSYVVNPHRISRVLQVLGHNNSETWKTEPVDITLGNKMRTELNAYMTSKELCVQEQYLDEEHEPPNRWEGFYNSPNFGGYYWSDMGCDERLQGSVRLNARARV